MTDGNGQGGRNVLVVSTVEDVTKALKSHLHENDAVKVVVPVVGQGLLDWLANDEKAFSHAETLAEKVAEQLPGETVETRPGEADIGLAIRDALATFPADEIVVAVDVDDEDLEEAIQADGPGGRRMIDGIPLRIVTTR
jgi:hypothetical protein